MMLRRLIVVAALAALAPVPAALCATETAPPAKAADTKDKKDDALFKGLGGIPGITAVVDDFTGRVGGDTRLAGRFQGADMAAFRKALVDQICETTGGPCTYTGRDMKTAHAGMGVTGEEFRLVMTHMIESLQARKVDPKIEGKVVGLLLSMKGSIVEKP